jgi:hypothetical protein
MDAGTTLKRVKFHRGLLALILDGLAGRVELLVL